MSTMSLTDIKNISDIIIKKPDDSILISYGNSKFYVWFKVNNWDEYDCPFVKFYFGDLKTNKQFIQECAETLLFKIESSQLSL